MISQPRHTIAIISVFLFVTSFLAARAQPEDIIVNNPEVQTGVLDNGLTYYVQRNAQPAGIAELRLVVRAGSVLEDEDQLGLAHFVEHMLFNGTEKFPGTEIIDVLESFGIDYGPEINAYTTFEETVYRLSVKTDDEEQFRLGFEVLEEWAFNATLDEDQFEKERGVIQEEWRVRRGAQARIQDQIYPVLFRGSRYAERNPIGDIDTIMNTPVEALRRFYETWYRPDLMAVIAVGDFDPDETVSLIKERFGGYQAPENPRALPEFLIPQHEETLVAVVHDPEATRSSIQLYVKYKPLEIRFRPDIMNDLAEHLFFTMLNQRLDEVSRGESPPFLYGYGFANPYNKTTSLAGLAAGITEETPLSSLKALLAEAERIQRYGFLESELNRAKINVMAFFENYWIQQDDMASADLINPLLSAYLDDDYYPSIDWQWETVQEFLPNITLEEVNAISQRLLSDKNRVVILSGPSVPGIMDIEESQILATLEGAKSVSLDPWVDHMVSGPLVPEPPKKGTIETRGIIPETGIIVWKLSNGATVFIKPTHFKEDEILFRAISLGGISQIEDGDYVSAQYAIDVIEESGLGEFSLDDLRKMLPGRNITIEPFLQETYEGLMGDTTPEDLEVMLQLSYLYQTAPRRDLNSWNVLMNRSAERLKNRNASPMTAYEDKLWEVLLNDHFRSRPITLERLPEADLDRALSVFQDRFNGGGDFAYVFVGDIDPVELEPLVEQWIGGLPPGNIGEGWIDRGMRNNAGVHEVSIKAGAEPLSVVTQVWTGDWDGSFIERYRIQSLASALEIKLTKAIREESGGTYSVGVYPNLSVAPHKEYRFIVRFSCDPERVDELTQGVQRIVAEWRESPPEDRFASDIVASQRRSLDENLRSNTWWIGQIVFAVATGLEPEDLLNRYALYDTLTPEIISQTAKRYLNDENYLEAVLYPNDEIVPE